MQPGMFKQLWGPTLIFGKIGVTAVTSLKLKDLSSNTYG